LYTMTSPILFGGSTDSTSNLIIVGQEGDKKPFILTTPKDGGDMFTNLITGSLTLKNLYWPTMATNGTGNVLFRLQGTNRRLIIEDFIHENQVRGDVIALGGVKGTMDIYLKNCYFRDMTQFQNPWNYAIFTRGDGNAIDTLWVENVTVANGGLCIMNKYCPVNFAFFNHNTIQNIPRYWNFLEQWKEAYFVNNVFINCLWMGEMTETMLSQLQSQTEHGPANGGVEVGIINLMRPSKNVWELAFPGTTAPTAADIKFLASDNLTFTSPFLDKYYNGEFNDSLNQPISKVDWGFSAAAGLPLPPQGVVNIPARFFGPSVDSLVSEFPESIIVTDNHDQVDPDMVTKMIADQAEGDEYAHWARNNYQMGDEMPARTVFTVGDYDPQTIPGPEGENGSGMKTVVDLPEDFTYNAEIVSTIDGMKLGAQEWYGSIADWDSEGQLALAKQKWAGTLSIKQQQILEKGVVEVFPNPGMDVLNFASEKPLTAAMFYDVTGRMVKQVDMKGTFRRAIDISSMENGMYIIQIKSEDGAFSSIKFIKK